MTSSFVWSFPVSGEGTCSVGGFGRSRYDLVGVRRLATTRSNLCSGLTNADATLCNATRLEADKCIPFP